MRKKIVPVIYGNSEKREEIAMIAGTTVMIAGTTVMIAGTTVMIAGTTVMTAETTVTIAEEIAAAIASEGVVADNI